MVDTLALANLHNDASNHPVARPGRLPGIFGRSGQVQEWAPVNPWTCSLHVLYMFFTYLYTFVHIPSHRRPWRSPISQSQLHWFLGLRLGPVHRLRRHSLRIHGGTAWHSFGLHSWDSEKASDECQRSRIHGTTAHGIRWHNHVLYNNRISNTLSDIFNLRRSFVQ